MRKLVFIALAAALSVLLLSVVFGIFVPAIHRVLVWPGFRLSKALGILGIGNYVVTGLVFSWVLWTVVLAAVVAITEETIWHRRRLFVACVVAACAVLLFEALGKRNKEYEGTWDMAFEHSDFHYGGECWRLPYWLEGTPELYAKWEALGHPAALRVKFIGDTTAIGSYGHLGQYMREIRVLRLIEVEPAAQHCLTH